MSTVCRGSPDAPQPVAGVSGAAVRIGYPRDRAFGFYYPGDLEKMEQAGAKLISFDSLRDTQLPAVDGLFIGGGFPETVMEALEANRTLRQEIRTFIERGGAVYAECGGLMTIRVAGVGGRGVKGGGMVMAEPAR